MFEINDGLPYYYFETVINKNLNWSVVVSDILDYCPTSRFIKKIASRDDRDAFIFRVEGTERTRDFTKETLDKFNTIWSYTVHNTLE